MRATGPEINLLNLTALIVNFWGLKDKPPNVTAVTQSKAGDPQLPRMASSHARACTTLF
jgi:hypothetical protein